jgi:hypothetical protein
MFPVGNIVVFPDNPYYQERFNGVEIRFWRFTDGLEGVFSPGGCLGPRFGQFLASAGGALA